MGSMQFWHNRWWVYAVLMRETDFFPRLSQPGSVARGGRICERGYCGAVFERQGNAGVGKGGVILVDAHPAKLRARRKPPGSFLAVLRGVPEKRARAGDHRALVPAAAPAHLERTRRRVQLELESGAATVTGYATIASERLASRSSASIFRF